MSVFGWSYPPGCTGTPNDDEGAIEVRVGQRWFAWTEDGTVLEHTGDTREREDGFVKIGHLEPVESELSPEAQLTQFIRSMRSSAQ